MSEQNVEKVRSWIDAFNRRNLDALSRLNHPTIEWQTEPDPDATTHRGRGAVQHYLGGYIESFPDLRVEAIECFSVGDDRVFATSRFVGQSAHGVPMDWLLTTVSTVEGGVIVRVEEYSDRAEAIEAVGLAG